MRGAATTLQTTTDHTTDHPTPAARITHRALIGEQLVTSVVTSAV